MHPGRNLMPIILAIFAVFILVASSSAIVFPSQVLLFAHEAMVGSFIWWAASARIFLAILLWFSAAASRTPKTFKVLAVLTVIGAVFLVVMGSERVLDFIEWFATWPQWGVRLLSTVGVAFGLFLLWSIFSKRADA